MIRLCMHDARIWQAICIKTPKRTYRFGTYVWNVRSRFGTYVWNVRLERTSVWNVRLERTYVRTFGFWVQERNKYAMASTDLSNWSRFFVETERLLKSVNGNIVKQTWGTPNTPLRDSICV